MLTLAFNIKPVKASGTIYIITYTLTIITTTGGTTDPVPGTYTHDSGSSVHVIANPDTNYRLANWELDGTYKCGCNNPITVQMDTNHTLKAVFALITLTYTLTITTTNGGTTNPTPGTYTHSAGTILSVTALPNPGYKPDHWILDGSSAGSSNPINILMNNNHNLQAVFAQITYQLTITTTTGGTTNPTPGTYTYIQGLNVQVTAIPEANYLFDHWELDTANVGSTNPYSVLMDKDHTLKATFVYSPSPEVHDIAVTNASTSRTTVGQGYSTHINVTVANQGNYTETFNVTVYTNTTIIEKRTNITLTSGNSTTITFTWNTAEFVKGSYIIRAYAWPVLGETETADNEYIDGTVKILIPGDVDGDGIVDIFDLVSVANVYGTKPGDPDWNPNADVKGDGIIDIFDLVLVAQHYGQTDP